MIRECVALLVLAAVAVRVSPIRAVRWFEIVAQRLDRLVVDVDPARLRLFVHAVGATLGTRCLAQSVVLACMLRRCGSQPTVIIGVRRAASVIAAHAWVEDASLPTSVVELHQPLWRYSYRAQSTACVVA